LLGRACHEWNGRREATDRLRQSRVPPRARLPRPDRAAAAAARTDRILPHRVPRRVPGPALEPLAVSMLDRITGTKRTVEANGHLPVDANLITEPAQLASRVSAWEAVQAARNIQRPHTLDVIGRVFDRFHELHGDRGFRDDPAIVGGIADLDGRPVVGVGDVVLAMQNAIYSVISPEGCAAILWRSPAEAERAAKAMRVSGPDLLELGVVDALIPEPAGGAHTDHAATAAAIRTALAAQL